MSDETVPWKGPEQELSPRAQRLWTIWKNGEWIDGALRKHGESDWELQIGRHGGFCARGRFDSRAEAIAYGDELLCDLQRTGWQFISVH